MFGRLFAIYQDFLVLTHPAATKLKLLSFKDLYKYKIMPKCKSKACKGDSATQQQLFYTIAPRTEHCNNKITVVGVGNVGMACAMSLLCQEVTSDLALIDCMEDKLMGEKLDLQHGCPFLKGAKIDANTDYSVTAGSKICVITAGLRQKQGETRLDLVQRNTDVLKNIVPLLMRHSPDTILLVVSNPCDILTYVAWKLSGLPKHKVFGSGTNLDTARFRFLISEKLKVSPTSCHGYIIGEHGDSSVAVWSGVTIGGVKLRDINPLAGAIDDPENWKELHQKVVNAAYEVIKLKGYTSWAVGLSVGNICENILKNKHEVIPVSVPIQGLHGVEHDAFLSLPAILGQDGISEIIKLKLTEDEEASLQSCAKLIQQVQAGIKF